MLYCFLKDFVNLERTSLQTKFKLQLDRFYESIGHVKKNLQTGFVSNFLSKSSNESTVDDRFISNDVATLFIDDAKKSLTRLSLLCGADAGQHAKAFDHIYDIICAHLCREHIFYALDLHTNALQSVDTKQEINLHIFPLLKQLNSLMYLFEQFTNATVLPQVLSTPVHSKISNKFKLICGELEAKVDVALEKAFTVIINRVKHVLQVEQKKTDFKSETDELTNQSTSACNKVLRLIESQIAKINSCLDGTNVNSALKELGIKYHRCIYDHLFRFEYNELGKYNLCNLRIQYCYTRK